MAEKIIFNGRVYYDEADMPPDTRQAYERINKFFTDANQDGVPDILQEGGLEGVKEIFGLLKEISKTSQRGKPFSQDQVAIIRIGDSGIIINGRKFRSIDEMPPDMRQYYQQTIEDLDPAEFDIWEEPWREIKREAYFEPHDDERMPGRSQKTPTTSDVIQEVSSSRSLAILLAVAGVLLCLGFLAWLILSG